MNRRGLFAALVGLTLAPVALKAEPRPMKVSFMPMPESFRKRALALSNGPRGPYPVPDLKLKRAWLNGHWVPMDCCED